MQWPDLHDEDHADDCGYERGENSLDVLRPEGCHEKDYACRQKGEPK